MIRILFFSIVSFAIMLSALSFAGVEDFNLLIKETETVEKDLHQQLQKQVQTFELNKSLSKEDRILIDESKAESIAVESKGFFKTKKNNKNIKLVRKIEEENLNRVSLEIENSNYAL